MVAGDGRDVLHSFRLGLGERRIRCDRKHGERTGGRTRSSACSSNLGRTLACVLVSLSPADGTIMAPGTSFKMIWVLQNVGSQTWDEIRTDLYFVSAIGGTRLSSTDVLDQTASVPPVGTYSAVVDMVAPSGAGQYGEAWSINENSTKICQLWNIINVSP